MANRLIGQPKSPIRTMHFLAGLFTLVFAASFANKAVAKEDTKSLRGEVIAIDTYSGTLTVKASDQPAGATQDDLALAIGSKTVITLCLQSKSPEDIMAGEKVEVKYHESDGKLIADVIDIAPVILACYDQ